MRYLFLLVTGFAVLLSIAGANPAAWSDSPSFPFVIPWDDALKGVATDVSFLNDRPSGVNGYIVVKGGHFVESRTGRRVRFLGTNFTFQSDYPDHADAALIAAHIAKLGINIVRIHHEDNNSGPLWDKTVPGHTKIDPAGIERLDYLISQLKAYGIYVDLNLHVSRQFEQADGFPASVDNIPGSYDKGIDNIDRRMIDLAKRFAHDYLTHVNPYTAMSYADDPVVAMIEINNENSASSTFGDYINFPADMPEPFRGELVEAWNDWLDRTYKSSDSVIASWYPPNNTAPSQPADFLSSQTSWYLQDQTQQAHLAKDNDGSLVSPADITATVPVASAVDWHTQVDIAGINLVDGSYYVLTFRAKADTSRRLPFSVARDEDDWRNLGLSVSPTIGTDWQSYKFEFQSSQTIPNHSRISFTLGGAVGSVSLADVRLSLATPQSLYDVRSGYTAHNIDIPNAGTRQQAADWHHFLVDADTAYADEMRDYLRRTLNVHANVIDTQVEYGGLASFQREAGSDYADNHAYWQHPSFPGKPWDSTDWNIKNTPMSDSLASGEGGTLFGLAAYRVAGKPYSVSEYNHPAPSDFRSEMFPEFATFAAAQDWDAIFEFDYGSYGSDNLAQTQKVQGFFSMVGDPLKESFLPSAALIFRAAELAPFSKAYVLHLPPTAPISGGTAESEWRSVLGGSSPNIFDLRLEAIIDKRASKTTVIEKPEGGAGTAIEVSAPASGSLYTAAGSEAVAAAGYVGGQSVVLGNAQFGFPIFDNNFASLTLIAVDQKPLANSNRLLLTIAGKAENQGIAWNATRTSIGWNWGKGPALADGIPATVTLTTASAKHVWALGPTGVRSSEIAATFENGTLNFIIGPSDHTIWYEIADN